MCAGIISARTGKLKASYLHVLAINDEKLIGNKFLIVEPLETGISPFIAIDNVGAGIGEKVLVAFGSAARIGCDQKEAPIDAAIVGIVDEDIL